MVEDGSSNQEENQRIQLYGTHVTSFEHLGVKIDVRLKENADLEDHIGSVSFSALLPSGDRIGLMDGEWIEDRKIYQSLALDNATRGWEHRIPIVRKYNQHPPVALRGVVGAAMAAIVAASRIEWRSQPDYFLSDEAKETYYWISKNPSVNCRFDFGLNCYVIKPLEEER